MNELEEVVLMDEQKLLKALLAIADGFEQAAFNLRAIVKEKTLPTLEVGEGKHKGTLDYLRKDGVVYAQLLRQDGKLAIYPEKKLQIKKTDPAIERFLFPRLLDKMTQQNGINYRVKEEGELLKSIIIEGKLDAEKERSLLGGVLWALEKAAERNMQTTLAK